MAAHGRFNLPPSQRQPLRRSSQGRRGWSAMAEGLKLPGATSLGLARQFTPANVSFPPTASGNSRPRLCKKR